MHMLFVLQEAMYEFTAHVQGTFGECTVPNVGPAGGTNIPQTVSFLVMMIITVTI